MNLHADKLFFLIILIGICFLTPLFGDSLHTSHDAQSLIVKSASFIKSIQDLQIPPRWSADLNYGFGSPAINFYYPLGGYLLSMLFLTGLSLEIAYKIMLGTFFIGSGLTSYVFLKKIVSRESAFGGAVIYMLSPYHFLDIYVRGHIGELIALAIAPLVLNFLFIAKEKISFRKILFTSISYALLVLSHNILALIFTILIVAYILIFSSKRAILLNFLSIVVGLGFSAYFWIPALYEGKYINSKVFVENYFANHFIELKNIFYAPWGFGPNINEIGGLAPQIGIVPFILFIVSLLGLRYREKRKPILFWSIILLVSIFFTNQISTPIWSSIHILEQFQFPWRFMAIISFAASVLSAYGLSFVKRNSLIYIVIGVVLLSSIGYIGVAGFVKKTNSFYFNYPGTGAYHGETTTIWTEGDASSYPKFPIEVITGEAEVYDYTRKSNLHTFRVEAASDSVVKDNTIYYPGWRVFVGEEEVPIQFQDANHRGIITFPVVKGSHNVQVKFSETTVRFIADLISILTVLFAAVMFLYRKKIDKLIKR